MANRQISCSIRGPPSPHPNDISHICPLASRAQFIPAVDRSQDAVLHVTPQLQDLHRGQAFPQQRQGRERKDPVAAQHDQRACPPQRHPRCEILRRVLKTGDVMCHFDGAIGDIAHFALAQGDNGFDPLGLGQDKERWVLRSPRQLPLCDLAKPTGETAARMNDCLKHGLHYQGLPTSQYPL